MLQGLPRTGGHGDVLLLGPANAGKSSLCNALVGREAALVTAVPGTTRDVLAFELAPGLQLWDGPGDLPFNAASPADRAALALRDRLAEMAAGAIWVTEASAPTPPSAPVGLRILARVHTKCDLLPVPGPKPSSIDGAAPVFVVSSVTGVGLGALREFLVEQRGGGSRGLSTRLHDAFTTVVAALERGIAGAVGGQPEELIAVDLTTALAGLDAIHGRSSPEDLLDRIFAGFCLGK